MVSLETIFLKNLHVSCEVFYSLCVGVCNL